MIDFKIYGDLIDAVCNKYSINTPIRKAHFLSQIDHETNGLSTLVENMNYSANALISKFGRHRITLEQCRQFGRTSKKKADLKQIANTIYGGAWGRSNLGNVAPTDGWNYRGRAAFQCTGRHMYKLYSQYVGVDFILFPEHVNKHPFYLDFAGWFWNYKNLSKYADLDDIVGLTKILNGGTNGLDHRIQLLDKYKKIC